MSPQTWDDCLASQLPGAQTGIKGRGQFYGQPWRQVEGWGL